MDDISNLVAWSVSNWNTLSGKVVFLKPDGSVLKHLWFTHAYCTGYTEDFNSTGTTGGASLRVRFTISPENCGVGSGNGDTWIAPAPRAYAAPEPSATSVPQAVRASRVPQAVPVDPRDVPPHLPAPQPSPDHKQVHLSAQEWRNLIKGRWDDSEEAKSKKFLKQYRQTEFHVDGDPLTYRVDKAGKMVAIYDAQKSYNITGTKNGYPHIPLTLNGQPTYAGTSHMYAVTGNQKNVVVIEMAGNRATDFRLANEAAGLTDVVKAQGLKSHQPPDGYTWHHRDDFRANPNPPPHGTCTMELVEEKAHQATFVHYGSCDQLNKHVGQKLYR